MACLSRLLCDHKRACRFAQAAGAVAMERGAGKEGEFGPSLSKRGNVRGKPDAGFLQARRETAGQQRLLADVRGKACTTAGADAVATFEREQLAAVGLQRARVASTQL